MKIEWLISNATAGGPPDGPDRGVWVRFCNLLAKLGAYVCVIKASSGYGMNQMFF